MQATICTKKNGKLSKSMPNESQASRIGNFNINVIGSSILLLWASGVLCKSAKSNEKLQTSGTNHKACFILISLVCLGVLIDPSFTTN